MTHYKDEILDEVHRIRAEIAAECGYDLHAYFEKLKKTPLPPGFSFSNLKPVVPTPPPASEDADALRKAG